MVCPLTKNDIQEDKDNIRIEDSMRDKLLKNPIHKNNSSFNNSLNQKI
jgi:hypothetical protein